MSYEPFRTHISTHTHTDTPVHTRTCVTHTVSVHTLDPHLLCIGTEYTGTSIPSRIVVFQRDITAVHLFLKGPRKTHKIENTVYLTPHRRVSSETQLYLSIVSRPWTLELMYVYSSVRSTLFRHTTVPFLTPSRPPNPLRRTPPPVYINETLGPNMIE